MIHDLKDRIVALPGFDEVRAEKAVSLLFRMALEHLPGSVSQTVFDTIPGSYELAARQPLPPAGPFGGIETMIEGAVANHLGFGGDPLMKMLAEMKGAGYSNTQSRAAIAVFLRFLVEKLGPGFSESITEAVPGLNRLR